MFKRIWEYYEKHGRSLVFSLVAVIFSVMAVVEAFSNNNAWAIVWVGVSCTFVVLSLTEKK